MKTYSISTACLAKMLGNAIWKLGQARIDGVQPLIDKYAPIVYRLRKTLKTRVA